MLKRIFALFLIIVPLWIWAQDLPFSVKNPTRYSVSGMFGYEKVDSVNYLQFRIIPEFNFWKIGLGLDLDFMFDRDMNFRKSNWDQPKDIISKIYYLRYAQRGEPFYFHMGGFPAQSLGNGLIMLNYNNMLLYPDLRNTGLMLGANPKWPFKPEFELFSSNVQRNQIFYLTAHAQPIADTTSKFLKVVKDLKLGFTVVADRNQYGNLRYMTPDSLNAQIDDLKTKPATVYGLDYSLPLFKTDKLTLGNYAEMAHIQDYGTGFILPGVYVDLNFLKVNLEYRLHGKKFIPAYFDADYEEQRGYWNEEDSTFVTKEELLKDYVKASGLYGKVQAFIGRKVKTMVAWENMGGTGLENGKSLWFKLWVDTQYKRLENFSFSYSKTNTDRLALKYFAVPGGRLDAKITFRVTKKRWFLIGKYAELYKDKNKDGSIQYLKETKHSVGVGVKYLF
jgi:hypothetical protein